jgi:hypothetical protein
MDKAELLKKYEQVQAETAELRRAIRAIREENLGRWHRLEALDRQARKACGCTPGGCHLPPDKPA